MHDLPEGYSLVEDLDAEQQHGDENPELLEEELELEGEIRRIELDIAILDLRSELESQEVLTADWQATIKRMKEEDGEIEAVLPRTNEDRQLEKDMKAALKEAEAAMDVLRQRLETLERQRQMESTTEAIQAEEAPPPPPPPPVPPPP
eukprot:TRINITY_DN12830_c2_g1_i1.p1 TRINITY_DN12830_c2_g1~~TRINITY_DN12830_c2_g1_i1.p1  ORF type:complete len:148 (+),score=55.68 TRINITY_DN12830_c2_g1_i1:48-491(+)